jgi:membrane associated rhomboid family serine protease
MFDDEIPLGASLVTVGVYERLSEARERGLVVAAMNLPYWVVRDGALFTLRVENSARDAVLSELQNFENERAAHPPLANVDEPPLRRVRSVPLFVAGWIFAAFWLLQNVIGDKWVERGLADNARIVEGGEWWRLFTALTLHSDFAHFAANLAAGLLFAAFMGMQFGAGVSWLAIVISGALGNLLNAWFYAGQPHYSLGASTAVFGALGVLVSSDFIARLRHSHSRNRWQLIVPIGAGLGLLAFLGSGDEQKQQTDYMAHLFGFCAGLLLGGLLAALPRRIVEHRAWQIICGAMAFLIMVGSWLAAK